jgi:two-component system, NarL family, sensor kinase
VSGAPTLARVPRSDTARVWAWIRVAAIPVIWAGERYVDHPAPRSAPFGVILAFAGAYALLLLAAAYRPGVPRPGFVQQAVLDLAFISALTYTSGGPYSQLRYAYFLLPIGAGLRLRPSLTALASVASVAAYLAVAFLYPTDLVSARPGDFEFVQALYLAWMGVAAVLLSVILTKRAEDVERLSATRGRLVAQALDAEDRERRRLAEALHDEAIQNLLAARQELASDSDGRDLSLVRLGLDRTIAQLRDAVFDLHPYVLEQAGLAAALEAVTARTAERAGLEWSVEVDPEATGVHDELLFSITRELVSNAARHSGGGRVGVRLRRRPAELVLEVQDDGQGVDATRLRRAPLEGHIGLASATERVEALDGELEIASEAGRGTLMRARIPLPPEEEPQRVESAPLGPEARASGGGDGPLADRGQPHPAR